ncbi:uncharacterized protein FOMMEDRAFT_160981 [Fomitiporia mediterranea MF3/22]|uniref:uncharacterized protein n=1 Tax=Fomitiporia mediterranea (strain MF3/22) TaxID=694068 RepID=UPI00044083A0|nr:uncharacterized protein FOMMEDRAFT_160981 [Fomitiporia mediterranea MF3/22]EJC99367.1 hypothetical protein FOMMEDRAFT_160981 [Fomitiporia mediterranea MF3/22]
MLSALPFHAAGPFEDTDCTKKYLLDKYISSYTPTLGALIDAQSSCRNGEESPALVVCDTSLSSAKKDIRSIKNCGIQTKLLSSKASHDAKPPNAESAFLSACHTAEQPLNFTFDEVLHLAAAMQFSGFRSVIRSMWELLDVGGPFFAKTVYEYMCDCDEGEARYKRAAAGLRKAAIELKTRDDIRAERWVNLIHIGA